MVQRTGHSDGGGLWTPPSSEGDTDQSADTGNMVDRQKGAAASTLRDMATRMREHAGDAPVPGLDKAAEAAAKPLMTGADYLEQHSPGDMWADLMQFCRQHPAGALFIGFAVGYFCKKLFR